MQTHYTTLCISRRATWPERQPASNHSLLFSVFLFYPEPLFVPSSVECMVYWLVCIPNYGSLCFWESVKAVDCCWRAVCFSLSVYWSVKAGQWRPAEEERMICPLLSVGFLCSLAHLNAEKRAVLSEVADLWMDIVGNILLNVWLAVMQHTLEVLLETIFAIEFTVI